MISPAQLPQPTWMVRYGLSAAYKPTRQRPRQLRLRIGDSEVFTHETAWESLMETTGSKSDWIHRFGRALMRLQPNMNAVTAAAHAVDAYPDSQDVEPEDAAKRWVDECGPDDCEAS